MAFKMCMIGCGGIASSVHGPSYVKYKSENSDFELTACCDLDEKKAREYQEKFSFKRYYTDFVEMLEKENPDAVCIITEEHTIADISSKVLEMGFPSLIEKPPGISVTETNKMMETANKYKVPNQVAFNRRFVPLVREFKKQITNTFALEEIHNVRYDFFRIGRKDLDFSLTAIHGIDTVKFLLDSDYDYIKFSYRELPNIGKNVANIYMDCKFKSGATAQLNFHPVSGTVIERATLNAYGHTLFLNIPIWSAMDSPGQLVHINEGKIIYDVTGKEISDGSRMFEECGFYAENKSFFDDIRSGISPKYNLDSAVQSVEIAECLRNRVKEYKNII